MAERTAAGLTAIASRRARGRRGGQPRKMTADKMAVARRMYASKAFTVAQIAATLGVTRGAIYSHLDRAA